MAQQNKKKPAASAAKRTAGSGAKSPSSGKKTNTAPRTAGARSGGSSSGSAARSAGSGRAGSPSGQARKTGKTRQGSAPSKSTAKASGNVGRELLLILTLALCLLLFLSLFGLIGTVGNALASVQFGLFGSLAWLFPFLLALAGAFWMVNYRKYPSRTVWKLAVGFLLLTVLCGLAAFLGGHAAEAESAGDFYRAGRGGFNGGFFGGLWYLFLSGAVGKVGSYVILFALLLILAAVLSGRALLTLIGEKSRQAAQSVREENRRYREESQARRLDAQLKREEALLSMTEKKAARGVTTDTQLYTQESLKEKADRLEETKRRREELQSAEKSREQRLKEEKEKADREIAAARAEEEKRGAALLAKIRGAKNPPEGKPAPAQTEAPKASAPAAPEAESSPAIDWDNLNIAALPEEMKQTPIEDLLKRMEEEKAGGARREVRTLSELNALDENSEAARHEKVTVYRSGKTETYVPAEKKKAAPAVPAASAAAPAGQTARRQTAEEWQDPRERVRGTETAGSVRPSGYASREEKQAEPPAAVREPVRPAAPKTEPAPAAEKQPAAKAPSQSPRATSRLVQSGVTASGILGGDSPEKKAETPKKEERPAPAGEESIFGKRERTSSGAVSFMHDPSAEAAAEEKKPMSGASFRAGGVSSGSLRGSQSGQSAPAAAPVDMTPVEPAKVNYKLPPIDLLKKGPDGGGLSEAALKRTAVKLEQTLRDFGVEATVTDISCGPAVTRFELRPEQGVKVSKISSLSDDIKLALAATEIRIEAPIPGKSAVGIEVPNEEKRSVALRSIVESDELAKAKSKLAFAVGEDIAGKTVVADLAKMPHLLIAGATGSGKSVCLNSLIISILYRAKPDEVQFIMIDPKVVELRDYNGVPHLRIPVVNDPKQASEALNGAVKEMSSRYRKFADLNVRDIKGYNEKIRENPEEYADYAPMPQIVVIVDEFADLMMVSASDVEASVCRLAQLARAAGIHLVLATQRPSVNVITGLIKANIQSRIALTVSSGVDSRTIIDMNGAEKLLGKGDMLFYPTGYPKPVRVQGCWVSDGEIEAVTDFWKAQRVAPVDEIGERLSWMGEEGGLHDPNGEDDRDELFVKAAEYIIENEKASIGNLQRVFRIGFNRAARMMDQLADAGIVGKDEGTKARQVLMDRSQFEDWKRENGVM